MNLMAEFIKHLKNRGHGITEIETMMLEAAKRIDSGRESNKKKAKSSRKKTAQKIYTYTGNITLATSLKTPSGRRTIRPSWVSMGSII
jgi:hypothetical protein